MKAIPQTGHRLEQSTLAVRRMRLALTSLRGLLDEELRPLGITAAQLQMLYQVRSTGGQTGASLARAAGVTPQTMQALLARSERGGWLRRGEDTENHRLVLWSITPAGRGLLDEGTAAFERVQHRMWKGVAAARIRDLNVLLERCLANLNES